MPVRSTRSAATACTSRSRSRHVPPAVQFDLGAVVGVEEHPVAGHDGADVRADSHGGRPGQPLADGGGGGDDDAGGGTAFALAAVHLDQHPVVQQADRQAGVEIRVGGHAGDVPCVRSGSTPVVEPMRHGRVELVPRGALGGGTVLRWRVPGRTCPGRRPVTGVSFCQEVRLSRFERVRGRLRRAYESGRESVRAARADPRAPEGAGVATPARPARWRPRRRRWSASSLRRPCTTPPPAATTPTCRTPCGSPPPGRGG